MNEIKVTNQKELDAIKLDYAGIISIQNTTEYVSVNKNYCNAEIRVSGNATIQYVSGNATIQNVSGNTTIQNVSGNATIQNVYSSATIQNVSDNATIQYVSDNATIQYVSGNATIQNVSGNTTIQYVSGNATIQNVSGNATIKYVYNNATIQYVSGNATIQYVSDNATIQYVYNNATIEYVSDNATIEYVSGNATIQYVSGNATILLITMLATISALHGAKNICAKGNAIIRSFCDLKIEKTKSVTVIKQSKTLFKKVNVSEFINIFPVETKGTKVILYKAVHKKDGKYFADYDKNYEYTLGVNIAKEFDDTKEKSCTKGIHVSHKLWAINFGKWDDAALLECEVDKKDIVVAKDCDGKVRARKINIIREVPKTEY